MDLEGVKQLRWNTGSGESGCHRGVMSTVTKTRSVDSLGREPTNQNSWKKATDESGCQGAVMSGRTESVEFRCRGWLNQAAGRPDVGDSRYPKGVINTVREEEV